MLDFISKVVRSTDRHGEDNFLECYVIIVKRPLQKCEGFFVGGER